MAPGADTQSPPGAGPRVRGPGLGRRLASRPRRGPSGQLPARRRGRPRGPRGTNGRNGRAVGEGAGGQGPEVRRAGRGAGSLERSIGRTAAVPDRLKPRALRCHEPEGGERSRESRGSGARRPRLLGHVPPGRPIITGGRGDVRAAAWPMTASPVTWPGSVQWAALGRPEVPGGLCVGGGWMVRWRL